MKPKRTISAYILLVGVLGLSIVGGILIFSVYSAFVKTQVTPQQATLIRPLDGEIDSRLLNSLSTRRRFSPIELAAQINAPTPEASPTASGGQ